jgi:hypothetical protein
MPVGSDNYHLNTKGWDGATWEGNTMKRNLVIGDVVATINEGK